MVQVVVKPIAGAPEHIQNGLSRLCEAVVPAAGSNFAALILYGGLARGRFRPKKSDVNVLIVLQRATREDLAAISTPLREAWLEVAVEPMVVTLSELPSAAFYFPTKFLDIKSHHITLAGDDPLAGIEIPRERIRLRAEQELRNLLLRLRHDIVLYGNDSLAIANHLSRIARPLALELSALLYLTGKETGRDDRSATIFAAAAPVFGLDAHVLDALAKLRHGQDGNVAVAVPELAGRTLSVLEASVAAASNVRL